MNVEHLHSPSLLTRSIAEDSETAVKRIQSSFSASCLALPVENRCYSPASAMILQSPAASLRQSYPRIPSNQAGLDDLQSVTVTSLSLAMERSESRATEKERANEDHSTDPEALDATALSPGEPPEAIETFKGKTLSRKEVLDKIGCKPRDRIEDAFCDSDHSAFASLLNRKIFFGGQSCASTSVQNALQHWTLRHSSARSIWRGTS